MGDDDPRGPARPEQHHRLQLTLRALSVENEDRVALDERVDGHKPRSHGARDEEVADDESGHAERQHDEESAGGSRLYLTKTGWRGVFPEVMTSPRPLPLPVGPPLLRGDGILL